MRTLLAVVFSLTLIFSVTGWAEPNSNAEMDEHILVLVKAQNFDKLESIIEKIETDYEKDYLNERPVDLVFDSFYRAREDLERLLSNWVRAKPTSYAAYMARGIYYTKLGWVKRGTRFIDKTTSQQLDGMTYFFQKAMADFEKAKSINAKALHPLCYEIEILMNFSQKDQVRKLYEQALKINPMSLTARWYYITTILPRWGGSTAEIEREVASARAYYKTNPALRVLDGRVVAELGDQAYFVNDLATAEQRYTAALKFGEHWYYNEQRAEVRFHGGKLKESMGDLDIALKLRPNFERALYMQGSNMYKQQEYLKAIPFFSRVIANNSYDHETLDLRGDCYRRLGKFDLALSDFEKAILLDPSNSEYLSDREKVTQMMSQKR